MKEEQSKSFFSGMLENFKNSLREEIKQEFSAAGLNPEEVKMLRQELAETKQSYADLKKDVDEHLLPLATKQIKDLDDKFSDLLQKLSKVSDGLVDHSEADGDDYNYSSGSRKNVC